MSCWSELTQCAWLWAMSPPALPPTRPELPEQLEQIELSALEHDERLAELELTGGLLVDQRARGVTFQAVRLTGTDLSGSQLEHLRIVDCMLKSCNVANVNARGARLKGVVIADSRLTGMALFEGELTDVMFQGCRVDLASFSSCGMDRVRFEDCVLTQSDFMEGRLQSVGFHGCDLTNGDFRGAKLKRCELRRTDLTGVQGVESLRGLAMEWPDIVEMAGVWAGALGIEVLDP
jgi:uncharacterized protein YjbI with pentapeptide repeats